ncbi:hypothetical protein J8I87_37445 [Paraburkholderia sp. LEh10]|uniref:hypothetical protein n=1 Tax=Paraburkholderia sp. LEh10 TaxID=2821353 RepID=UPI001AEAC505|nr:hypothetical protein [Paraburkholderia sp. LEh10]MBP0595247.1 hypothetical protein [Paraburkholderia sp. LEh10]
MFHIAALLSILPVLFSTRLPDVPFFATVLFFRVVRVAISPRMAPIRALLTTVPARQTHGVFLSANSAVPVRRGQRKERCCGQLCEARSGDGSGGKA